MTKLHEADSPSKVFGYIKTLDGSPLYCVYHPAALRQGPPQQRIFPVIIAPPLFEERKSSYAALRKLAAALAAAGIPAMRFDYRGSGESGGDPALRRWSHLAEDLALVRKTTARLAGARDAILLGVRLSATLALQETQRAGGEGVIAIAPVINGETQVRQWKLRSKIRAELTAAQGEAKHEAGGGETLDFDGYSVSPQFFDDVAAIDLNKDLARLSCPSLTVQVSHRTDAAPETAALLNTLGNRAKLDVLRLEPFWDKIDDVNTGALEAAVLRWLTEL